MAKSTEVATQNPAALALGISDEEYRELIGAQEEEFSADTVQTPILKIGQPLTKEVTAEQAEAGEFINTLTGKGLGNEIEFIVAYYQAGRFAVDRESNRTFIAFGDLIPDAWEDLVGAQFVGTRFDEHPDAEETYKERVNNKEIEWGKGPLISTTHNYTGFVVQENEQGESELHPVRLSLQRTNMPAVRKIINLKRMSMRDVPFFFRVFDLKTERKQFARGSAYLLVPSLGRETTDEERQAGLELAKSVRAGRVRDNLDKTGEDAPTEPAQKGGLGV